MIALWVVGGIIYFGIGVVIVGSGGRGYANLGRWWLVMPVFWICWPGILAEGTIDRFADWLDS